MEVVEGTGRINVPLHERTLGSRVLVASGISGLRLLGSWSTGRSVGVWVGWLVGLTGLVGQLVGFVGCSVAWLALLVSRSVG
jgi:hypothetical protein